MRLYTHTLQRLGIGFAVVNSLDGYDEISLTNEFKICTNTYEGIHLPADLGLSTAHSEDLYGGDTPQAAARIFDNVLQNQGTTAQTDCVLANAAFAIQAIEQQKSATECVAIAREALVSGKAWKTLQRFIELNS